MLFYTKLNPEDILLSPLCPNLAELVWDLCAYKKSLKRTLIPSVESLLKKRNLEQYYNFNDEFLSEFNYCLVFLSTEENLLSELQVKFKTVIYTLLNKFHLNRDLIHFIILVIGLFLNLFENGEKKCIFGEIGGKAGILKKNIKKMLKTNDRFKKLRRRLKGVNNLFIEKLISLLTSWKSYFERKDN